MANVWPSDPHVTVTIYLAWWFKPAIRALIVLTFLYGMALPRRHDQAIERMKLAAGWLATMACRTR